jgi:hypothetical protein
MLPDFGKLLMGAGLILLVVGGLLTLSGKIPWLGRLPGDLYVERDNFRFYFPLATSILLSLVVSLLIWLFRR